MRSLMLFSIGLLFCCSVTAQQKKTYRVTVNFASICCGVPDSKPLFDAIVAFKKKNKIKKKLAYTRTGPLGKEGEYMLGFYLKELTQKQKTAFIKEVKRVVPTLKDRGVASVEENVPVELPTGRATTSEKCI